MRRKSSGFTLIEVMIVVAIIAILSAIALPAYSEYVKRSRITEAVASLSSTRVKMEQYFQDNRSYTGAGVSGTVAPCPAATVYFTYTCPATNGGSGYLLTATGIGAMAGFSYTVDQNNNRTSTGPGWTPSGSCWILKKDGSC